MIRQKIDETQNEIENVKTEAANLANELNQLGRKDLAARAQHIYERGVRALSSLGDVESAIVDFDKVIGQPIES